MFPSACCPVGQDEILLSLTYLRRVRLDRAICECAAQTPLLFHIGREGDLAHTDATTHAVGVACGRWIALSCSARCSTISHFHCLGALVTQASPSIHITHRPPDGRQMGATDRWDFGHVLMCMTRPVMFIAHFLTRPLPTFHSVPSTHDGPAAKYKCAARLSLPLSPPP